MKINLIPVYPGVAAVNDIDALVMAAPNPVVDDQGVFGVGAAVSDVRQDVLRYWVPVYHCGRRFHKQDSLAD